MNTIDELIELTSELIRIKSTTSRPEEINTCATYIHTWFKANGVASRLHHNNGVPCISVLPENSNIPVLLMAHFDVVEAKDNSLFNPRVEAGSLWGRGSLDDKYGVALCMLHYRDALRELEQQGKTQQDMAFGLLLTGDEENGGHDGAGFWLKKIHTDFCIALDGGAPDTVITKQKGILNLRLTAQGKAAHGARPWRGVNAVDLLISDYLKLKELFPDQGGEHWHRTLNLGTMHTGSNSLNQVPDHAEALFDIRYTENDDPDELVRTMRANISGQLDVLVKEPQLIPYDTPYLPLLLKQHPDMHPGIAHGASDARFLTERGTPGVVWGAWGNSTAHSKEEHVTLESLSALSSCLHSFLRVIPIDKPMAD